MGRNYVVDDQAGMVMPNAAFAGLMAAVLAKGAPFRFQAHGFSMAPFIRPGDTLTLVPARPRLGLGEVVAFTLAKGPQLAVHRVVARQRAGYLIQGDNALEPDGCIPRSAILGRVVRVERDGRPVWAGLGLERIIIAWLSRRGWLAPGVALVRRLRRLGRGQP